jgi:hypothetical protein
MEHHHFLKTQGDVLHKLLQLIEILRAHVQKTAILCLDTKCRSPIFGARMFIFSRHEVNKPLFHIED